MQIGGSAVAPPVQVVDGALVVGGVAAGHGAAAVEGAQGSALGSVGEAGGAAEVEAAGCGDDGAVADDDLVDAC